MLTKGMWSEIERGYAGRVRLAVFVLDGHSKRIVARINGSGDFADYRAAIDSALATAGR